MMPLALLGAFYLIGGGPTSRVRAQLAVPPYAAWLEANRDPNGKQVQNFAYPLSYLKTWKDASFDPGLESKGWDSMPKSRFPLRTGDELEVLHLGHREGRVRISSISPVDFGFNALVLGRTAWASDHPPTLAIGEGFTALWRGPAQASWASGLDEPAKASLQIQLREMARTALHKKANPTVDSEGWGWCHTPYGEAGVGYVRFEEGNHQRSWTSFVLVRKDADPIVLWSSSGHDEGEFGAPIFQFLDAEDLDGDGIPEVITRYFGFEGTSFVIFKFDGKKVRQVYSGSHLHA